MSASHATEGDVAVKVLQCVMTVVGVALVDRKGRKFLLKLGTGGIVLALLAGAFVFYTFESQRVDVKDKVQAAVQANSLNLPLAQTTLAPAATGGPTTLTVLYSYGDGDRLATVLSGDHDPVPAHPSRPGQSRRPAPDQARPLRSRPHRTHWLARHRLPLPLHRLLRARPRSRRLAHALGTHAHPHPVRRHGHRPAPQPGSLHHHRRRLPADGRKFGYFAMFFLSPAFTVVYFVTAASSCRRPRARRWRRSSSTLK